MPDSAPNILMIYCDELRADVLGCYGGPDGLTPHIDRLAHQGVRFDACWCSSPVCVPSRWSCLTGLEPTQTGVYHNEAAWPGFELPLHPPTVLDRLHEAGWHTANTGKIHLPCNLQPFAEHVQADGDMGGILGAIDHSELDLQSPPGVRTLIGGRWPDDRRFPPEQVTDQARDWLVSPTDQPRLIRASYLQPHTPVTPPDRYRQRVAELAPDLEQFSRSGWPSLFERTMADNIDGAAMPPEQVARCQMDYLAMVAWLDDQVGKLVEAAQQSTTPPVIILTADHGAALGESGMWAKQSFAPASHRVPLIVTGPDLAPRVDTRECSSIDLAPTIAAIAGITPDPDWHGHSLLGANPHTPAFSIIGQGSERSRQFPNLGYGHGAHGSGWPRRACIRDGRWRYERNVRIDGRPLAADDPECDAVLIDRLNNPDETCNVIEVAEHSHTVQRLSQRLDEWLDAAIEPSVIPTR